MTIKDKFRSFIVNVKTNNISYSKQLPVISTVLCFALLSGCANNQMECVCPTFSAIAGDAINSSENASKTPILEKIQYTDTSLLNDHYYKCDLHKAPKGNLISETQYRHDTFDHVRIVDDIYFGISQDTTNWFNLNSPPIKANQVDGYQAFIINDTIFSSRNKHIRFYNYKTNTSDIFLEHSYYYSPIGYNNNIYVTYKSKEGEEADYFIAKYTESGEHLWTYKILNPPIDSIMPLFAGAWDGQIIFFARDFFIASLDAETGHELWRRTYFHEYDVSYSRLNVYELHNPFSIDTKNRTIISEYRKVVVINLDDGKIRWKRDYDPDRRYHSIFAIADGLLYFTDMDEHPLVYALDGNNGEEVWRYELPGEYSFRSAIVTEDLLIFGQSDSSLITALDRKTGTPIWKKELGHNIVLNTWNQLACYENRLIVKGRNIFIFE